MAQLVKVVGLPTVLRRIKGTYDQAGRTVETRLKRAGLFLQRESMLIVPIQFGPLRASGFTRSEGKGLKIRVIVGYTAAYAVYVHENKDALHGAAFNAAYADRIAKAHTPAQRKMWFNRGPNQTYKFLERPLREKRQTLIAIVEGRNV